MDPHTLQVLDHIRRKVMRRYESNLYKTESVFGNNDREKLEWALTQRAYSAAQKKVVREVLEQQEPILDRTTTRVDQEVAARIEREIELEVQAAFTAGVLKKQPMDRYAMRHMKK